MFRRIHVRKTKNMNAAHVDDEFEIDLAQGGQEQRASGRRPTTGSSLVGTLEYRTNKIEVRIEDLSLKGVGVTTAMRIPDGEECRLTLTLSACGSDYELMIKSRVRYCDVLNSRAYHAGLMFVDMSPQTRDTLKLLIR
jgi:hypothetical protein